MSDFQKILSSHPAISTLTEGLGRGFLLYFLPMAVLKREIKKNILRRALAIGGFCGSVRLIRYYTQYKEYEKKEYFRKVNVSSNILLKIYYLIRGLIYKYPSQLAGCIGGIIGILLDPSLAESQLFSIWLLVRAIRCITPTIPYSSTITMCIAASQILSSYARAPTHLDSNYLKFLNIHGGQNKQTLHILRTSKDIKRLCTIIHPDSYCSTFLLQFFIDEFKRAIRLYAPLYVVFFLFSRSKNVSYLVQNLIRSSTFLSLYCTLAWSSGCLFHRIIPVSVSRFSLFSHAWVAGLATLLERENRRSELAVYCMTYAVDSVAKTCTDSDIIPKIPYITHIIFSIALGLLVRHRKQQPWIFSHFMLGDEHPLNKQKQEKEIE